jgi:hypothetical protein
MCPDAQKLAASKNSSTFGSFSLPGHFTVKKIGLHGLREIQHLHPFLGFDLCYHFNVSWEISCEYINNLCADFNHFFLLFPGS